MTDININKIDYDNAELFINEFRDNLIISEKNIIVDVDFILDWMEGYAKLMNSIDKNN